uniref:Large ribosomal subunit protein bL21m n=1 Tax=Paramoeba aestuarina TaxID=180227 RepID=A0A7S4NL52_9EUKA|mmetsp:Transcript_1892/g.2891  ORF Transcript_1892/g.2891 Transcript_1892/m.2891 type:complete len:175 (+) Transcript_1892:33-557(+)
MFSLCPVLKLINPMSIGKRLGHTHLMTLSVADVNETQTLTSLLDLSAELFTVVLYRGEQYKMAKDDTLMLPRLNAMIGEEVAFKKCLMVGGKTFTAIGRPFLDNVRVTARIEEHKKSHNVIYYLDRHKRKNIQWKNNQNQVTIIRVEKVEYHPDIVGPLDKETGRLTTTGAFED